jgi:hypothetical protein
MHYSFDRTMSHTAETTHLQLELRDLRNALAAMRDRLEIAQNQHEMALVRVASDASAEKAQLRATAAALRDE